MVVTFTAGGTPDAIARIVAGQMERQLGQSFVVLNRPGASGVIGSQLVASAPADGYTLLMVFPAHPVNPSLFKTLPYDTVKAFAPITVVSTVSTVLIVGNDSPVKTTQEMIALAKAKPGALNYGSVGSGSLGHLAAELMRSMAQLRITHVPYKGSPQVLTALVAGEIQLYFIASAGTVVPQEKAGRVRAIGVSSPQRSSFLPNLPAIAETLPGYDNDLWWGVFTAAKVPKATIDRLNTEIHKTMATDELKKRFAEFGAVAAPTTPEGFNAIVKSEIAKWSKVIREANIQAQ